MTRPDWTETSSALAGLEPEALRRLAAFAPRRAQAGEVIFRPGEAVEGYVIVLEGRLGVYLIGPTGRESLLYGVEPGQSCIQSTLGPLAEADYSAEAVAETASRFVLIPRAAFLVLIESSPGFRRLVFAAFAERMQAMMRLVEALSFHARAPMLAAHLLARADGEGGCALPRPISPPPSARPAKW